MNDPGAVVSAVASQQFAAVACSGVPRRVVRPLLASISPSGNLAFVLTAITDPDFDWVDFCEKGCGEEWRDLSSTEGSPGGAWFTGDSGDGDWEVPIVSGRVNGPVTSIRARYGDREAVFPVRQGRVLVVFWPRPSDPRELASRIEILEGGPIEPSPTGQ